VGIYYPLIVVRPSAQLVGTTFRTSALSVSTLVDHDNGNGFMAIAAPRPPAADNPGATPITLPLFLLIEILVSGPSLFLKIFPFFSEPKKPA
jgi:hypothetical protein